MVAYTASDTTITALGEQQHFQSGSALRNRYANSSSAYAIQGLDWPLPNLKEIDAKADSSEGQVILDSAYAFFQGFYPASSYQNTTLANGTTIFSPLGGYTYIPVESVEFADDVSFEAYSDCPNFTARNTAIYNSTGFKAVAANNSDFLKSLAPLVGERNVTLSNMWNIFDYMNVNYIHNATFYNLISLETMKQARALANYHEWSVFTDPSPSGIGNVAGRALLPNILNGVQDVADATNTLKMVYLGASYKPFLSFFNMTEVDNHNIVDYASVMTLEVWNSTTGAQTVRMNFRNGSSTRDDGSDLVQMSMFNQSEIPLDTFLDTLTPYALTEVAWCNACGNNSTHSCDIYAEISKLNSTLSSLANSTSYASITSTDGKQHVSPVVAGVIGAMLAWVVAALAFVLWEAYKRKTVPRGWSRNGRATDSAYQLHTTSRAGSFTSAK
ncbi:Lysosomal & prostatic acid phosphatases [Phaffia rhodozyma]|uniref:Lysosomal & prostatic acid phosphatases n=1 Tax=Phaffia rhodozyma TaxID=264483 RepID=A0A0F7SW36_PHARH|nr:Lysosomal & prostatic acid phosphatases [Phaffia rhodozyma]